MKRVIGVIGMARWRQSGALALALALALFSRGASAALEFGNVMGSFTKCTWRSNGDGTSTIELNVFYLPIRDALGKDPSGAFRPDSWFTSRLVRVYTYDSTGKPDPGPQAAAATLVTMNGTYHTRAGAVYTARIYDGGTVAGPVPGWDFGGFRDVTVRILINDAKIKDWPAVGVGAGNSTQSGWVFDYQALYVSDLGGGSCRKIDPGIRPPKPPPIVTVDMAAPDWDLGELQRGEHEVTLAKPADQLCFTYMGEDGFRNFVIDATSANGVAGNRYLLRNVRQPAQSIPYSLTLDSGTERFPLPNTGSAGVRLNKAMRTCFIPTFKTSVEMSTEPGDYSDVLSFTVMTKT
ncbi:hypothetical protein OHZ10_20085 [Burkholderia arboris]|uniref:Uncharacterized protein n=1 Tax=Burkholderia arboris TaxID=488730 RepID=A0ABZ3DRS2_9BURK